MGRTLLVTKAFIGRAKLALINSHLESTAEFAKQRTAQLKIAFEISSTFDKEYNVIFGGDLNLRDKEVLQKYNWLLFD
jgi:endonuclease/exonuclease/phosphatase (EEP) superfamily protein YafD